MVGQGPTGGGARTGIDRRREAARRAGGEEWEARRQEVIKAAAKVFQRKGFREGKLSDVAAELGADRATLYYYISSKEELLREIVEGVVGRQMREIRAIAARPDPAAAKVRLIIHAVMRGHEDNYPYTYVFIQEDMGRRADMRSDWARGIASSSREVASIVLGVLEDGVRAGELRGDVPPHIVSNALFGFLNWTHRWFRPGRAETADEIAEYFTRLLLGGLEAGDEKGRGSGAAEA